MSDSKETNNVGGDRGEMTMMRIKVDDTKAGMKGLDKDKINKIILEASKGSKFYLNEQRREAEIEKRLKTQLANLSQLTESQMAKARLKADELITSLELSRDLSRTIVHVDMDCFYAAVHMRDDPTLKSKPMAVGGIGMLSTSNYLARKFGVRAAMPGFIAKKLCPSLVIIPSDFPKYNQVAAVMRSVIAEYDPDFESMGCDEAYLDLTEHLVKRISETEEFRLLKVDNQYEGCCKCKEMNGSELEKNEVERSNMHCDSCELVKPGVIRFGASVAEAVEEIRLKIFLKTKLTASAGVAPNAPLAKICSDQNKPNGQFLLDFSTNSILDFVRDLPIRKWPGVGKVSEKMLNGLGIEKLGDMYEYRAELFFTCSSEGSFEYYAEASIGFGRNRINGKEGERKSISCETTFQTMSEPQEMFHLLQQLCNDLAEDCKSKGFCGKTVTLKLKQDDFKVLTRSTTVSKKIQDAEKFYKVASASLQVELAKLPYLKLRLMGVRLSQLEDSSKKANHGIEKFFNSKETESTTSALPKLPVYGHKTTFVCPICDTFFSSSLETLNAHVDECLIQNDIAGMESKQSSTTHEASIGKDSGSEADLFEDECLEEYKSDDDLFECYGGDEESRKIETNPSKTDCGKNKCLTEVENLEVFQCPICNDPVKGTLVVLNQHIDVCISGSSETLKKKDKQSFKRKRKNDDARSSKKLPRIDSYFASKNS